MSENWAKIDRVNFSIVIISPFWVHIPTSCKGVGFGTESARAETDNQIELREEFRPMSLMTCQNLGGTEIFKIFVVCDNINRDSGTLEIMPPSSKGCKDH